MKKYLLTNLLLLLISTLAAQNNIKMEIDYGIDNKDLEAILRFENINMETFTFTGDIQDKNYIIKIKEFQDGNLVNTDTLFNSSQDEYFKIRKDSLELTFLSKHTDDNLTFQMTGGFFSSRKLNYKISSANGRYAYKDFLGSKKEENYTMQTPFPLFTIITPTVYEDGSTSYCRVAQSGITPEDLGKEFNIPHYFITTIEVH
jgi:hypothetical protein